MIKSFRNHWREYLMEAWGLGVFMVSAMVFTILFEHPESMIYLFFEKSPLLRRFFIGIAMGLTAIAIMYSPWGKKSGAHLNPAVTLSFLKLKKIALNDAIFYIIFQFVGGYIGVVIFQLILEKYSSIPQINYVVTIPGAAGIWVAFGFEALLSFLLFFIVLISSNQSRIAALTPVFAGICLTIFITLEAPFSGMSINPARTIASAIPAHTWKGIWIYFVAPPLGMLLAAEIYQKWIHGEVLQTLKCAMTINNKHCKTHAEYQGSK